MKQSKEAKFIRQSEEESDGCRKMFSGFNILDNQKPQDMLANIDLSSVHTHTGSPSSSLPYNENELSASSSNSKIQETLIQNLKTVAKGIVYIILKNREILKVYLISGIKQHNNLFSRSERRK